MTALLRSDAYRALRSRWLWVVLGMIALSDASYALVRHAGALDGLTSSGVIGGVQIVTSLVVANLACADADSGFDRTVLSARAGRRLWFAEKCLFAALFSAAFLLVAFGLGALSRLASGPVARVEAPGELAAYLGAAWLGCCAYAALTVTVGHLTRNRAATLTFAALASTGLLEGGLVAGVEMVWFLAGGQLPGLGSAIAPWLPTGIMSPLGAGAAAMLAAEGGVGVAPAVRSLVVCLPLALLATAADALLVSRRDVA